MAHTTEAMRASQRPGTLHNVPKHLQGRVLTPVDADYDAARRVWNAAFDARPAVIVQCLSPTDVALAIEYARDCDLEVAVRGGAHSIPGLSTCEGGLVIDLSRFNRVVVDAQAKRARVQAGALLADLDAATQAHGLATPAGTVSHTGVAGLTLGGGMGWLTRLHGLTIDNLEAAQVVLADGRIVDASDVSDADLFWALRGGGGNFGVVTEFEFRLHDLGPLVEFGFFFWPAGQAHDAMRLMREVIAELPRTMSAMVCASLTAPPAPFVPAAHQGQIGHALLLPGFGEPAEHSRVVDRIRRSLPPLFDWVTEMPYVELQKFLDEGGAWGQYSYDKGAYFEDLTEDVIDILVEMSTQKTSPLSVVELYRLDGAYSDVGEWDTAFAGGRTPRYAAFGIGLGRDRETMEADREWVRAVWDALGPQLIEQGYVNALEESDHWRVPKAYGAKFARLTQLKRRYDPDNVFHRNINIAPAPV